MTIRNTIDQLQSLNATIEGVKVAPTRYPGSINSSDLPLVLVWPGPATSLPVTARAAVSRTNREYNVRVYVEAVGQNDYDSPARDSITLLDRFLWTYFDNRTLGDGYTQIVNITDSGLVTGSVLSAAAPLVYAGTFYKGFTLTVNVIEMVGVK